MFPRHDSEPDWHLPFEKTSVYVREIVRAKDALAALYADRVYSKKLPYRKEALESFYLCLGYGITFLVGDRLLRVNALCRHVAAPDILLPRVPYRHDPTVSALEFVWRTTEYDPYFNQWVVNALLPHLEQVPLPPAEIRSAEGDSVPASRFQRIKRRAASALADGLHNRLVFELSRLGRDLPCEYEAVQIQNIRRASAHFFWPRGRLCALRPTLLRGDEKLSSPTFGRREFGSLDEEVAEIFKNLLANAGETIHLRDDSLLAIAPLISELLPTVAVEEVEAHASAFLQEMSRFRGNYYFCGSPYGGHAAAFRTFAAKQLGKKILSTQHSAWGGYLANGALISELLIDGCNDYVTFGWTNEDPNLSRWIDRPVVLPSPFLSELQRESSIRTRRQSKTTLPPRRRILVSTGFVYRFPSVYDSFLRVDTLGRWARIIGDVLQKLAQQDLKIVLIMYDKNVATVHREIFDQWLAIDPSRIREHPNHNARVRHIMQSGKFQDEFDAVIWDLPAGGFSEALYCGIPTFSLWNTQLIKSLEPAEPFISDLLEAGVFFSDGDGVAETMKQFYGVPGWYESEAVQRPIRAFARNFLLADPNWQKSWAEFLKSI